MAEAEDRTQAPSDRRLLRAREDGQAPLSRELVTLSGLAAAGLMLSMAAPGITQELSRRLQEIMVSVDLTPGEALGRAAKAWSVGAFTFMGVCAVAGAGAVLLQTNFPIHGAGAAPDIGRINPFKGLKRIFGGTSLVEAVKALAKLAACRT